jgi:hypothetical protein
VLLVTEDEADAFLAHADAVDKAARTELRKAKKKPQPRGNAGQSGTEVARNRKLAS